MIKIFLIIVSVLYLIPITYLIIRLVQIVFFYKDEENEQQEEGKDDNQKK